MSNVNDPGLWPNISTPGSSTDKAVKKSPGCKGRFLPHKKRGNEPPAASIAIKKPVVCPLNQPVVL